MNSVQPFRAITLNVFPELLAQLQPKHAMLSHNFRSCASILENEQHLYFSVVLSKNFCLWDLDWIWLQSSFHTWQYNLDCLEWGTQFCRFQLLFFKKKNYNGFKFPCSYALFHNCFMNIIIWLKLCLVVIKAALFQQQCLTCHVWCYRVNMDQNQQLAESLPWRFKAVLKVKRDSTH